MASELRIRPAHLMMFYRRMASMAASGMGAGEAVGAMAQSGGRTRMAGLIRRVDEKISQGAPAGGALGGELRRLKGVPEEVFGREPREVARLFETLAGQTERAESMRTFFWGSAVYPVAILTIVTVILSAVMVVVVPVFKDMYGSFGGRLPLPTRIIVSSGGALSVALQALIGAVVAALVLFRLRRRLLQGVMDRLPFFRGMGRQVAAAEFMEAFSMLRGLDVPPKEAMRSAAASIGNEHLAQGLGAMAERAPGIGEMIEEMKEDGYLPDLAGQMVSSGERTGTVEAACTEAASVLFNEAEFAGRRFMGIGIPVMMLGLGCTVGFIVIALYLPIFSLITMV